MGWDVFCWLGHRRCARDGSVPPLRAEGKDTDKILLSDEAIERYLGRYQTMLAARQQAPERLSVAYRDITSLVLTIDGLQPEKGHETFYVVRGSSALNRGVDGLRQKQRASHTPLGICQRQARRTGMDPTTTFCPRLACPARGQTGQGNIGIHSRKDKRFLCTACHKTFSATKGTALYRLRTATETITLVVTLLAHGCPPQAIVAAFGFDERTVASWMARGGVQG
jgi:transposase-like protein